MLVYANRLQLHGVDAEEVAFKAIGGWLKEQLGFGLHPNQLLQNGEYRGQARGTRLAATDLQLLRWRTSTMRVGVEARG